MFDPAGPVLGIDPGLSRCGYGAVLGGRRGRDRRAVAYGVIRTAASDPVPERLRLLEVELAGLVADLRPAAVVVERVLFQANVRTAMAVGQASGLALLVAARAGIPVAQYSPNEVKLAVAGYGGADKLQVQTMVARLLGLTEVPSPPDAADALALALAYDWGAPVRAAAAAAPPAGAGFDRAVAAALARGGAVIGSVRGTVLERSPTGEVLVEVGGVGYRCLVPLGAVSALAPGAPAFLFTHLHVREDAMTLYGFPTRDERDTFEVLIGASGVGPKLALAVLSVHPPGALRRALADDDLSALCLVPGVGKRTAQKLMVDLKARIGVPDVDLVTDGDTPAPARAEVRAALGELGYDAEEIRAVLTDLPPDGAVEELLRTALKRLAVRGVREELLRAGADPVEAAEETTLRPRRLDEFVGQPRLKEHLDIVLGAARKRGQAADHLLFAGPPGTGKTSLAGIVAAEMEVALRVTSGPALERAGDLAAILTNLEDGDVLFVDEIHRLPRAVEEVLYPAMEDFQLDIVIGKGPSARSIRLDLPRFTLVGATTRTGLITGPLRDRFGFVARLDYYEPEDLEAIVTRAARILGVVLEPDGARELACRARGTPRIANRLLKRVRDYAEVRRDGVVTGDVARAALTLFEVDELGLDKVDRAVLRALCVIFAGAPVGLGTLAVAVGEEPDTVEDVYEPFLLKQGMLQRTPRGRVATAAAFAHLGVDPPGDAAAAGDPSSPGLW